MTFDEYNMAMTSIHKQLQEIANRTFLQAVANCADSSNPDFVVLMRRHAQLTKQSTELTERMLTQINGEN